MNSRRLLAVIACVGVVSSPSFGWGQGSKPFPESFDSCSEDTAARLRFIEQRLDEGRTYAQYWWLGWLGFYGLGTAITSAQAATENDAGKRADHIVGAVKALGGTIRGAIVRPTAKHGADAMVAIPATSQDNCLQRLATGEDLLRKVAKEAQSRYSWSRHFFNIGVNVGAGLIVAEGFDQPSDGWTSAVIGVAVGEAMILSSPWRGRKDLADYESEFAPVPMPRSAKVSVQLVPMIGGVGLQLAF